MTQPKLVSRKIRQVCNSCQVEFKSPALASSLTPIAFFDSSSLPLRAALFLVSSDWSRMTGEAFNAPGGRLMN